MGPPGLRFREGACWNDVWAGVERKCTSSITQGSQRAGCCSPVSTMFISDHELIQGTLSHCPPGRAHLPSTAQRIQKIMQNICACQRSLHTALACCLDSVPESEVAGG